MKDLLVFIVKNIVEKPEDVEVVEDQQEGISTLKLSISNDDIGKVIGKNGKMIKALRSVLKILYLKSGQKVYIEVVEGKNET